MNITKTSWAVSKAINWDANQKCLEEALVIDPIKVKKAKIMRAFYNHYTWINCGIIFILLSIAALLLPVHSIVVTIFSIVIAATAFVLMFALVFSKNVINEKLKELDETPVFTQDFIIFAKIVKSINTQSLIKSDVACLDFFYLNELQNPHMMYKLFNLVNIYAMDSFLLAAQANDTDAMMRILNPMMSKIIKETVEAHEKYLEIEANIKKKTLNDLNSKIDLDLEIFDKHNSN